MTDQPGQCHLLLVEDEMLAAMMVEERLTDAGYRVSKAARLQPAMELAREADIDCAILDIHLDGAVSYPVAVALSARDIPFLFASAHGAEHIPTPYNQYPVLPKPYDSRTLLQMVDSCLQTSRRTRERTQGERTRFVADPGSR